MMRRTDYYVSLEFYKNILVSMNIHPYTLDSLAEIGKPCTESSQPDFTCVRKISTKLKMPVALKWPEKVVMRG